VNEDPLPLFADKFYYPDCFLNRDNFGRVMGVLAFGRGLAGDGVQRVFAALDVDRDGVLRWPEIATVGNWTRGGTAWVIEIESDRERYGGLINKYNQL